MSNLQESEVEDSVVEPKAAPGPYWSVCQTFSNRVHRVRPEIEKVDRGTFLPTYARHWSKGGLPWSNERQLMPGYIFFRTEPDGWGDVKNIEGVYAVLTNAGRAGRVLDDEMRRLVLDDAMGVHNKIEGSDPAHRRGSKRRRPRPSKRARAAA